MALLADVTALPVPAMKLSHEKDTSLRLAKQTPPMIGTSDA